jgi:hypothetical protein
MAAEEGGVGFFFLLLLLYSFSVGVIVGSLFQTTIIMAPSFLPFPLPVPVPLELFI